MAKKTNTVHPLSKFAAYVAAICVVCVSFAVLQLKCMNNQNDTFVSNYCLSDTNTRTIIAAILTVAGFIIKCAVADASNAYRTAHLNTGINEGVYIATVSTSIKYQLSSLRTSWILPMTIILFCVYAPGSLQTLANRGINVSNVYVKNRSSVLIYDAYSYYNASSVISNFNDVQSAIVVLSTMREYSSSANSIKLNNSTVSTKIIRNGFISSASVKNSNNENTNSIKRVETIASLSTSCNPSVINDGTKLENYINSHSTYMTSVLNENLGGVYAYNITYNVISPSVVLFESSLLLAACESSCYSSFILSNASLTLCTSYLTLSESEIIYTLSTRNITVVEIINSTTTVDSATIGELSSSYSSSVESSNSTVSENSYTLGLFNVYSNYPPGLFNDSISNIAHSKLCSSISQSLGYLWTNYGKEDLSSSTLTDEQISEAGNNFIENDRFVSLYNVVLQTYVSTAAMVAIVGSIVGFTVVVCCVGIAYSCKCMINMKDATENALIDVVRNDIISAKRAADASNDPSAQRKNSFSRVIYCGHIEDGFNPDGTTRDRIAIGYDDNMNKLVRGNKYF